MTPSPRRFVNRLYGCGRDESGPYGVSIFAVHVFSLLGKGNGGLGAAGGSEVGHGKSWTRLASPQRFCATFPAKSGEKITSVNIKVRPAKGGEETEKTSDV